MPARFALIGLLVAGSVAAQVRPIYDQGAGGLARQLNRLQTTASVLHTGAHPDDEDSALVAWHARGAYARTAYLSLTRGSGGQNIIGAEQSDLLGVIRTEELLQARRLDGAGQYFTRANDFGYSKHRDEAERLWDTEALLEDMVRTIRLFRPTVVISRWSGTPADGHGHHQFSGYLTPLAVEAAADPARFPDQVAEGLAPWRTSKLYAGQRIDPEAVGGELLAVDTGRRDPVLGQSYFAIGMQGRSQQKTQQMGSLELHGTQYSGLRLVGSNLDAPSEENGIFDGVDSTIAGITAYEPAPTPEFEQLLGELQDIAATALAQYDVLRPQSLTPVLAEGVRQARLASEAAQSADARRLLDEKTREFESALVMASGITVDAVTDREMIVPGGTVRTAVRVFLPEPTDASVGDIGLSGPDGWSIHSSNAGGLDNEARWRRRESPTVEHLYDVQVPADSAPTEPYWLESARDGFMYDWQAAGDARTLPFGPPLLTATAVLEIGGTSISVDREVEYRMVDRVRGEIRRRLDVVPAVAVRAGSPRIIVAASEAGEPRRVTLTLRNNDVDAQRGRAGFRLPTGWQLEPATADFELGPAPASTALEFELRLPPGVAPGNYELRGFAETGDNSFDRTMREIAYPHIRTHRVYEPAATTVRIVDVEVADVAIGYVMGSGDSVPESLRRLGITVTLLDDEMLASGNLSAFGTIVVGIRASQVRSAFVANNQRLLDFVAAGGTLVVQYQQPDFIAQGLAPYEASMEGNVRVVDETAPVTILEPAHPVFNFPNRIVDADFDDWIQERNNYNFTSFDRQRYVPLTESHDPGEPPSDGAMLIANIGDGNYVYTTYSWFRQLPNGTPGAYRLFANLLSLPAADRQP